MGPEHEDSVKCKHSQAASHRLLAAAAVACFSSGTPTACLPVAPALIRITQWSNNRVKCAEGRKSQQPDLGTYVREGEVACRKEALTWDGFNQMKSRHLVEGFACGPSASAAGAASAAGVCLSGCATWQRRRMPPRLTVSPRDSCRNSSSDSVSMSVCPELLAALTCHHASLGVGFLLWFDNGPSAQQRAVARDRGVSAWTAERARACRCVATPGQGRRHQVPELPACLVRLSLRQRAALQALRHAAALALFLKRNLELQKLEWLNRLLQKSGSRWFKNLEFSLVSYKKKHLRQQLPELPLGEADEAVRRRVSPLLGELRGPQKRVRQQLLRGHGGAKSVLCMTPLQSTSNTATQHPCRSASCKRSGRVRGLPLGSETHGVTRSPKQAPSRAQQTPAKCP
jgi:hypothetical protein